MSRFPHAVTEASYKEASRPEVAGWPPALLAIRPRRVVISPPHHQSALPRPLLVDTDADALAKVTQGHERASLTPCRPRAAQEIRAEVFYGQCLPSFRPRLPAPGAETGLIAAEDPAPA